jgi:hypothetical protein
MMTILSGYGIVFFMQEELIAPCGMNCAICTGYLAMQNDIRKKGINMSYCTGCRARNKNCAFIRKRCALLSDNRVQYCYECSDFPCENLVKLDNKYKNRYRMSMIENLEFIRDNGMQKFLMKEEEKWRCPECGGTISCHNGLCYRCQLDKLRAKRRKSCWED